MTLPSKAAMELANEVGRLFRKYRLQPVIREGGYFPMTEEVASLIDAHPMVRELVVAVNWNDSMEDKAFAISLKWEPQTEPSK